MKKKIMIIDDDQDIRFLVKKILVHEGFEVEEYPDGYALFDKVSNWPDLFILDIELPGVNGLQLCKWVKKERETANIPVLFMSGSPELEVLAMDSEAEGYLAKPFSSNALLAKINDAILLDTSPSG